MTRAAELRAQAAGNRRTAALARRVGPGLSIEQDRLMMQRHALELDAEASGLEVQADELESAP
jgi:hypothetical protein